MNPPQPVNSAKEQVAKRREKRTTKEKEVFILEKKISERLSRQRSGQSNKGGEREGKREDEQPLSDKKDGGGGEGSRRQKHVFTFVSEREFWGSKISQFFPRQSEKSVGGWSRVGFEPGAFVLVFFHLERVD